VEPRREDKFSGIVVEELWEDNFAGMLQNTGEKTQDHRHNDGTEER